MSEELLDRVVEVMKKVPNPVGDFQSYTREQARAAGAEVARYVEEEYQKGAGDDQYVALGNIATDLRCAFEGGA